MKQFLIRNKEIRLKEGPLAIESEIRAEVVQFVVANASAIEGVSEMVFYAQYRNSLGETGMDPLTKALENGTLILSWLPSASFTKESGKMELQIVGFDGTLQLTEDETYQSGKLYFTEDGDFIAVYPADSEHSPKVGDSITGDVYENVISGNGHRWSTDRAFLFLPPDICENGTPVYTEAQVQSLITQLNAQVLLAQDAAESASDSAADAEDAKDDAEDARDDAKTYASDAQDWASHTRSDGQSPQHTSDSAKKMAQNAATSASNAASSETSAATNALKAEGYAVGKQNGSDVESGSTYYENNAKYYCEKAAQVFTDYALVTEAGYRLDLELDSTTYVLTPKLYNKNGALITTGQTVDLPIESVVVSGTYDSATKKIILTLQSGGTVEIPVGDLISGLATLVTGGTTDDLVSLTATGDIADSGIAKSAVSSAITKANSALQTSDIIDSLTSTSTVDALSAKQGNVLSGKITAIEEVLMGQHEVTVSYPEDTAHQSAYKPDLVPAKACKWARVDRLRGKTRAWNQLIKKSDLYASGDVTISGGTASWTGNGTVDERPDLSVVVGHRYILFYTSKNSISGTASVINYLKSSDRTTSIPQSSNFVQNAIIFDAQVAQNTINFTVQDYASGSLEIKDEIILRDLSLIMPDNTPTTVADALQRCPDLAVWDAYGYSLVDTVVDKVESKSPNIVDIDNVYNSSTFNLNGTTLTNKTSASKTYFDFYLLGYDADSNYDLLTYTTISTTGVKSYSFTPTKDIVRVMFYHNDLTSLIAIDHAMTLKKGVQYNVSFDLVNANPSTVGGLVIKDIQINVYNASINGVFHPYLYATLTLPSPVSSRSAGSGSNEVADEIDVESGVPIEKVGAFNVGSLLASDWNKGTNSGHYLFYHVMSDCPYLGATGSSQVAVGTSDKYPIIKRDDIYAGKEGLSFETLNANGYFYVLISSLDNASSTTSDLVTALNGFHVNLPLVTPLTKTSIGATDPFIKTQGGGTIRTHQTQSPVIDNCLDVNYDIIP